MVESIYNLNYILVHDKINMNNSAIFPIIHILLAVNKKYKYLQMNKKLKVEHKIK